MAKTRPVLYAGLLQCMLPMLLAATDDYNVLWTKSCGFSADNAFHATQEQILDRYEQVLNLSNTNSNEIASSAL